MQLVLVQIPGSSFHRSMSKAMEIRSIVHCSNIGILTDERLSNRWSFHVAAVKETLGHT